ncbi:MAG: Sensor histidine kinase YycG [Planctomycetota bacterium]|jgi:PAS domain S-box-containing protein
MERTLRTRSHEGVAPAPLRGSGHAWPALAAVAAAALGSTLLDGLPGWIIGGGAGLAAVLVLGLTRGFRSDEASPLPAPAVPAPEAAESLLRRAIEVRCDERTAILEHFVDGVLLVDAHGETRYANRAARELLGPEAGTVGTRGAVDALPPQVLRAVQGVASSHAGERRRVECELRNEDATPVVIVITLVKEGSEALAAIIVRNVRAEREADRMKSEFVAKASHELRTPLSSLRAYAELLADGEVTDEAQRAEFAGIILGETARLGSLVDRMLDISRIESGMARANLEETDLAAMAAECVASQQVDAGRRGIALSFARGCAGAVAPVDRSLIRQVMLNLLSNALKYTPEGGRVEVEVDIDNLARSIVVSVRDTGLGIPAHAVPRLFGKFYRVENHEKVAKGTGLGLNLCRNIVEGTHGGQIGVDSEVGVGSRFWFAIPLEQAGRKAA